jgi:hypothetical protein
MPDTAIRLEAQHNRILFIIILSSSVPRPSTRRVAGGALHASPRRESNPDQQRPGGKQQQRRSAVWSASFATPLGSDPCHRSTLFPEAGIACVVEGCPPRSRKVEAVAAAIEDVAGEMLGVDIHPA